MENSIDDDEPAWDSAPNPDLVHWQPTHRPHGSVLSDVEQARPAFSPAGALGLVMLGSAAMGAVAVGALAIGALAIGRLAVGDARFRRLQVDELVIGKIRWKR